MTIEHYNPTRAKMDNPFDEMRRAVRQAELIDCAVDRQIEDMLALIVGRLRRVHSYGGHQKLKRLKRELRDFNINTGKWKE